MSRDTKLNSLVVDWRFGGRIHFAVPAPQGMNREVLARGQRRHGHGRHGDRRDGPRIQLRRRRRRVAAAASGLSRRGEEAVGFRQRPLNGVARYKVGRAQFAREARRRRRQDHGVVGGDVILASECSDVLYAK